MNSDRDLIVLQVMNNQASVIKLCCKFTDYMNACKLDMFEAQDLQTKTHDVFLARWSYPMLVYRNGIGIQLTSKDKFLQFLASSNRVT